MIPQQNLDLMLRLCKQRAKCAKNPKVGLGDLSGFARRCTSRIIAPFFELQEVYEVAVNDEVVETLAGSDALKVSCAGPTFQYYSGVFVGSRHVHTLSFIFPRSFSHSSGDLARVFLMADSSTLDGKRWPHRGQFCGLGTTAIVASNRLGVLTPEAL